MRSDFEVLDPCLETWRTSSRYGYVLTKVWRGIHDGGEEIEVFGFDDEVIRERKRKIRGGLGEAVQNRQFVFWLIKRPTTSRFAKARIDVCGLEAVISAIELSYPKV